MKRSPKNEMQPWRTLQCCCSYWDLGRRGEETGAGRIFLISLPEKGVLPAPFVPSCSILLPRYSGEEPHP